MLQLLKRVQPERGDLDEYAIFGYRKDGSADGLTGRHLEITGKLGEKFLNLMKSDIPVTRSFTKKNKRKLMVCNCR
jgi:hypothetical protein